MNSEKIELQLIERYGPLMTLQQLADVLHRSKNGLSFTLSHPADSELARALNSAKVRLGRSVYFRSSEIAAVLVGGSDD